MDADIFPFCVPHTECWGLLSGSSNIRIISLIPNTNIPDRLTSRGNLHPAPAAPSHDLVVIWEPKALTFPTQRHHSSTSLPPWQVNRQEPEFCLVLAFCAVIGCCCSMWPTCNLILVFFVAFHDWWLPAVFSHSSDEGSNTTVSSLNSPATVNRTSQSQRSRVGQFEA